HVSARTISNLRQMTLADMASPLCCHQCYPKRALAWKSGHERRRQEFLGACSRQPAASRVCCSRGTRWSPLSSAPRCGSGRWVNDAVVISEGVARITVGCRSRTLGQHRAVPGCPVVLEAVENVLVPVLEIGPLARVLDDVEQELVAGYVQILPVAV